MKTTIRNVEIKSVAAWLPANKISLLSFCGSFPEKQVRDVIRSSGAEYVYRAEEGQKASDLCFNAAEHLIERDNIDVSIRPRACFSPSYNKVKSQTKHVWLLTLL